MQLVSVIRHGIVGKSDLRGHRFKTYSEMSTNPDEIEEESNSELRIVIFLMH